jgi:enoyl-CoA hydratase/carnithine racemase
MVINLPTDTKQLILTEDNDVLTITLNNPQYKNALSEELTPYLRTILKKLKKQNKYKILLIRGKGDSFCSGGNIKKMNSNKKNISRKNIEKINDLYNKQLELTHALSSLEIPTVAVITGPAAGAGLSLALSCDIRIGSKKAFFLSNYSKIGLTGDYGISWYLTNLLGPSKAKELMFCNHRIYADEAYKIGILNFLFTKNFESNLKNFLDNLLLQSHYALKLIKKNIDFAGNNNLRKTLKLEAKHLIMSSNSEEHKLAVAKFKKK